jgi:hypothetical protein
MTNETRCPGRGHTEPVEGCTDCYYAFEAERARVDALARPLTPREAKRLR